MVDDKLAFLSRILGKYQYSSSTKEAIFYCPFCQHHNPKFSINVETDHWRCWRASCDKNGRRLLYVISKFGTKSDLQEYVKKYKAENVELRNMNFDSFFLGLPKEFSPLVDCKKSISGRWYYDYLLGRGLSDDDILRHKIGVCFKGEYANSLVFPSFDKTGKVNYFTTRRKNNKYWSPEVPRGYKNTIIFNELNVDWSKPIVIVEGFIDMVKSVENTVPLFGSTLVEDSRLFESIVLNDSKVVLALDPDARKKSSSIAKSFTKYGVSVYKVDVDPYGDVGEMTREEFRQRYNSRSLWTEIGDLRDRMASIC